MFTCTDGYVETVEGTCFSCDKLRGPGDDQHSCSCANASPSLVHQTSGAIQVASVNRYGVCQCPAGHIVSVSGKCISCADLSGVGAMMSTTDDDTVQCQCSPYAFVNDEGVCTCNADCIETKRDSGKIHALPELLSLVRQSSTTTNSIVI